MICASCIRAINPNDGYFTSTQQGVKSDYHLKCKPVYFWGKAGTSYVPIPRVHNGETESGQPDLFSDGPHQDVRD
jgi:hypothetical protein